MNAPEKNVAKVAPVDFKTAPHFPIYMDYSATTPIDPRVAGKKPSSIRPSASTSSR
jgi:cysteine desulfurase